MRKKRIKLNGARTEPNVKLSEGDVFRFYLSDELLDTGGREKTADFREVPPEIDVYTRTKIYFCATNRSEWWYTRTTTTPPTR